MNNRFSTQAYEIVAHKAGWGGSEATADATKMAILDTYVVGKQILDVGCAGGLYLAHLHQRADLSLYGLDVDKNRLRQARKRVPKATLICGDVTKVTFKPQTFDTVIAFDVLEHIDDVAGLSQMKQWAKKRIIFTVPATTADDLAELFLLYGHHQDPTHMRTYSELRLRQLCDRVGIVPEVIEPIHPLSVDELCLRLFEGPLWLRRLMRKMAFLWLRPKRFNTNWLVVADVT